jgi:hypothetical protein
MTMRTALVRYKVRDTQAAEANEALVHAVYDELRASAPVGLRYGTFKLDDGTSFVHLAVIDTADGSNPLVTMDSFRRFQQGLPERCLEPPVAVELTPVDAYRLPGPGRVD